MSIRNVHSGSGSTDSLEGIVGGILQLVVDIPEDEELIWEAYQDEPPNHDEEEARKMAANDV